MKALRFICSSRGFSLVEMLVTVAVSGFLVLATAVTVTSVTQWGKSSENSSTAYDMMISVSRSFQSPTAWSRTVSDPLNVSMRCLIQHADCTGQGGAFRVNDENGILIFDPSIAKATAGAGAGATTVQAALVGDESNLSGFGKSGLCTTFNPAHENGGCPFRYDVQWAPHCPAVGPCINPPVKISATLVLPKYLSSSQSVLNSKNYSISYEMGSYNPKGPVLTPSVFYTNINQSVTANVLTILGTDPASTIVALSSPSHGTVIQPNNGNGNVTYTPSAGYHGLDTFNATIQTPSGAQVKATLYAKVMTKFSWTGAASDANWSSPRNWCGLVVNSACSNTYDVPGHQDTAIFDTACTRNCSPSINTSASLAGIEIDKGFKGTLTQAAGSWIYLSGSGYHQADGKFMGSNSQIYIEGSDFVLTGGKFVSTSDNLETQGSFLIGPSAQFSNNGGRITISSFLSWPPLDHAVNVAGHPLQDFYLKASSKVDLQGTTIRVDGKLTLGNSRYVSLNNGTISSHADIDIFGISGGFGSAVINVVGNPLGQTINGLPDGNGEYGSISNLMVDAGTNAVTFKGHPMFQSDYGASGFYKIVSGNVSFDPASQIEFTGYGAMAITTGTATYGSVTFTQNNARLDFGTSILKMGGLLTLAGDSSRGCQASMLSGTISTTGDVNFGQDGRLCAGIGSTQILVAGNVSGQTLTAFPGAVTTNVEIAGGSNRVAMSGDLTITDAQNSPFPDLSGSFVYTSGNLITTGTTLSFAGWYAPVRVVPGSVNYNNVNFVSGQNGTVDLSGGTMKISGDLTLGNVDYHAIPSVDNGTLAVSGNVHLKNKGAPGTAVVSLVGSAGTQTIFNDDSGLQPFLSNLVINSSGASVALNGLISISGGPSTSFTNTSNTAIDFSNGKLAFSASSPTSVTPGTVTYGDVSFNLGGDNGALSLGGNTMIVGGTLTIANSCDHACGTVNSGTISARGNVVIANPANSGNFYDGAGSVSLRFEGSGNQTLSQSGAMPTGSIVINSSGTVTLSTDVNMSSASSTTLKSGLINLAGHGMQIPGSLDLAGNQLTKASGVLVVGGVVAGFGKLYAGMVNP